MNGDGEGGHVGGAESLAPGEGGQPNKQADQ